MEETSLVIFWVLLTLLVVSLGAIFSKRGRPEILVGLFSALMMMVPTFGGKPTEFGPFIVNAPIIVFSSGFLLTDMLSEFYGKAIARRAVIAGFFGTIVFAITSRIALRWDAPAFWQHQDAYETVFSSSWRIVIASFLAYLVAQFHDVWAFHFWKRKFKGKHLWLRNNLSTFVSQVLDSAIFLFVAFYGVLPIWKMFVSFVVFKTIIAILDTPFIYAVRWYHQIQPAERRGMALEPQLE